MPAFLSSYDANKPATIDRAYALNCARGWEFQLRRSLRELHTGKYGLGGRAGQRHHVRNCIACIRNWRAKAAELS